MTNNNNIANADELAALRYNNDGELVNVVLSRFVSTEQICSNYRKGCNLNSAIAAANCVSLDDLTGEKKNLRKSIKSFQVKISKPDFMKAINGGEVEVEGFGRSKLVASSYDIANFLANEPVSCLAYMDSNIAICHLIALSVEGENSHPIIDELFVFAKDIAEFLVNPNVPASNGGVYSLDLSEEQVSELLLSAACRYFYPGSDRLLIVRICANDPGPSNSMVTTRHIWSPCDLKKTTLSTISNLIKDSEENGLEFGIIEEAQERYISILYPKAQSIIDMTKTQANRFSPDENIFISLTNPVFDISPNIADIHLHSSTIKKCLLDKSFEKVIDGLSENLIGAAGIGEFNSDELCRIDNMTLMQSANPRIANNTKLDKLSNTVVLTENRAFLQAKLDEHIDLLKKIVDKLFATENQDSVQKILYPNRDKVLFNKYPKEPVARAELQANVRMWAATELIKLKCPSLHSAIIQMYKSEKGAFTSWETALSFANAVQKQNYGIEDIIPTQTVKANLIEILKGSVPVLSKITHPNKQYLKIIQKLGLEFIDDSGLSGVTASIHGLVRSLIGGNSPHSDMVHGGSIRNLILHINANWEYYSYNIFKAATEKEKFAFISNELAQIAGIYIQNSFDFEVVSYSGNKIIVKLPANVCPQLNLI